MSQQQIIESDGDIFASGCEALVNPVDAETGAQSKGLAAAFKRRWPARCADYRAACLEGRMQAGEVMLDDAGRPWILFAATKRHWRALSSLAIVQRCCDSLVSACSEAGIRSLAIPALGCGEGRCNWVDVRPLILAAAARMTCERVVVFGPKERR